MQGLKSVTETLIAMLKNWLNCGNKIYIIWKDVGSTNVRSN